MLLGRNKSTWPQIRLEGVSVEVIYVIIVPLTANQWCIDYGRVGVVNNHYKAAHDVLAVVYGRKYMGFTRR